MRQLPDSANIVIPSDLASDLFAATEALPDYENRDFYEQDLQRQVYEHIRQSCRDGFHWVLAELQQRLRQTPFCAVVKGLQFDDGHYLLVALNRAFGTLVARPYDPITPRAQLIHHIQPGTDKTASSGTQKLSERLHTDGAERPVPFRYLSMQCVRPDAQGGGHSRLLDIDALRETVIEEGGLDLLRCLQEQPVPWKIGDYLGGGVTWLPVLKSGILRWRRYTIDDALANPEIKLPKEVIKALDMLGEIIASTDRVIDFFLEAQDCVMIDNWRCLHGRTPIPSASTDRLMLRAWVQT